MGFISYTTIGGQTWAELANIAYGDVTKIPDLIADNPNVPARPIIEAGTTILFRVIERENTGTNFANLPPWKKP